MGGLTTGGLKTGGLRTGQGQSMARPKEPGSPSASPAERQASKRALVVGIDEPSLRQCQLALERSGFRVERLDTGLAVVVAARQEHPDLIVMDLQLRDVSSHEAVSWLRSNAALAATPIYVLTTSTDEESSLSPRCTPLRKPVSATTIMRMIGTVGRS
jgi:two-component system cell cycle response regulator DivK